MQDKEKASIPSEIRNALMKLAQQDSKSGIRQRFVGDEDRAARFSHRFELSDAEELFFDFSKSHISSKLIEIYSDFSDKIDFEGKRASLFAGEPINTSEQRAVLHTLLRDPANHGQEIADSALKTEAEQALDRFRVCYGTIQEHLASRKVPIKDIIHIGIGGSSLGTQLLFEALKAASESIRIHFVGNIDGHQLAAVLADCEPLSTLVIGVSKTFSTAETLQNIRSVGEWFEQQGVDQFLTQVYAVTANSENAAKFGVPVENTVVFPQWVGGRYSVWSAVSLSAALVLGFDKFEQFLSGAASMDRHFLHAAPADNLSYIAAALDHYYANFFDAESRAIFAYDYRLRSLVDYLQQLETESNGKDRQINGQRVDQHTSPIIWGGVGTNVQHSVFQMLHQGTHLIPAEFLLVANAAHERAAHHQQLLANGLAQPTALLSGQSLREVQMQDVKRANTELAHQAKVFSGERPSTTILLSRLTPTTLGALLSFYEQRAFCYGALCNINSFDQMGVELGKRLADEVLPRLISTASSETDNTEVKTAAFDSSTEALIRRIQLLQNH